MSRELDRVLSPDLNFFDTQSSEASLQKLFSIYLCYFDEIRGHVCLFCFPKHVCEKSATDPIIFHPIWFIDATGRKEKSDSFDFEYQLSTKSPDFHHHVFPVEGSGLNRVELEFGGSVYLAAKFSGASHRAKKRSGMTLETPETYVLIVEAPSALRFLGAEILSTLHKELTAKIADNMFVLIDKKCLLQKPIKTELDQKTIELGDELECELIETCQSIIPQVSMDALQEKIMAQFDKQEERVAILIKDLIKAGILAQRKIKLESNVPKIFDPLLMGRKSMKLESKSKDIQMTDITLLDKERTLVITVINNSESCIRNVDAKLIYETDFFEIHSWGHFIPFWAQGEELNFHCQRVQNDEEGVYVFHLDDKDEKLLIRTFKVTDLYDNT
ncbi:MAG: hypothetical protein ACE5R6_08165 [Candidatus Heimdallarchaeota archaeon]